MMDVDSLLDTVVAEAERGEIVFPTHSEVALRVQQMLDGPDCAIDTLGKLIFAEPLLSARVLSVANSVAYNPSNRAVTEIRGAISRIGFSTLRAVLVAIIVRQMNEMPLSSECRALAGKLWEHTASVAALARVIARRVTHQDPDAAFFGGIVHEVGGFYLLSRASVFPRVLTGDLERWHCEGEARVGRVLLKALDVPAHIQDAVEALWCGFLAMPPVSLGDTLLLADELSPVESPLDTLVGKCPEEAHAELEMRIDDATLSSILAESAEEIASLSTALKE